MRHPSANTRMRQLVVLARQRHTVRQRKESCALAEPATSYSKSIGVLTACSCSLCRPVVRGALTRSGISGTSSKWTCPDQKRDHLHSDAGRAGHAGSTEAAVSAWVLRQVLLVVVLRVVEGRLRGDLGRDRAVTGLAERGLERLARLLRGLTLRRRRGVDRAAVLRADVVPLAHALGRVMALPE